MARNTRWFVFADDVGDPGGSRGTTHFGYALVAIPAGELRHLTEMMSRARIETETYHEAKSGGVDSPGFGAQVQRIAKLANEGRLIAGAVSIAKEKYKGRWLLAGTDDAGSIVPADPNLLRNYVIRKGLELLFDGIAENEGTLDLVLDRVSLNDAQVLNLRRYLRGEFNQYGPFAFPTPTHVTHADSRYVDGLQVADHIAKLSHRIASRPDCEPQREMARSFLRMQSIVTSRPFTMDEGANEGLTRRARDA